MKLREAGADPGKSLWKDHFEINPNVNEYGNGKAQIVDFAVVDSNGIITSSIEKGSTFQIKSKVQFNEAVQNPIFTYTFKNVYGTAITGTNTMYEKVDIGTAKSGEVYICTFEQDMDLQGGEYLLSISCTGYSEGVYCLSQTI